MNLPESLNPVSRRVAERLLSVHPEFGPRLEPLEHGHFEASIPAPEGSRAGALVVCTAHDGDIWVHFAPDQMWYAVDNAQDMLRVVDQLLRDEVLFARTVDANAAWTGTTLVRCIEDVKFEEGQTVTVMSWSGRRDDTVASAR